jgi:hypothetical protein
MADGYLFFYVKSLEIFFVKMPLFAGKNAIFAQNSLEISANDCLES